MSDALETAKEGVLPAASCDTVHGAECMTWGVISGQMRSRRVRTPGHTRLVCFRDGKGDPGSHLTCAGVGPGYAAVVNVFPKEKAMVFRERASKSYRVSAYFVAKVLADQPIRILSLILYAAIIYWMVRAPPVLTAPPFSSTHHGSACSTSCWQAPGKTNVLNLGLRCSQHQLL